VALEALAEDSLLRGDLADRVLVVDELEELAAQDLDRFFARDRLHGRLGLRLRLRIRRRFPHHGEPLRLTHNALPDPPRPYACSHDHVTTVIPHRLPPAFTGNHAPTSRTRNRTLLPRDADRRLLQERPPHLPYPRRTRLRAGDRHPLAPQTDLGQRAGGRALRASLPALAPPPRTGILHPRQPQRVRVRGRDSNRARLVFAQDIVRHRDEPPRRPPGQLPRHLRLPPLPLLDLVALGGLQVLHARKERRR